MLLVLLTVTMLAVIWPGGSAHARWWHRVLIVLPCVLLWELGVASALGVIRRRYGADCIVRSPGYLLLAIMLASVPVTIGMVMIIRLVTGHVVPWSTLFGQSLFLALMIGFARRGLMSRIGHPVQDVDPAVDRPEPTDSRSGKPMDHRAFLAGHATALAGGRLLALQAEDHYLRIHSDRGTALVLMRLGDAVAALGEGTGWRVHRSFWVAADATARVERRGQSWQLVLENGLTVPVSRNAARALGPDWFGAQPPAGTWAAGSTAE